MVGRIQPVAVKGPLFPKVRVGREAAIVTPSPLPLNLPIMLSTPAAIHLIPLPTQVPVFPLPELSAMVEPVPSLNLQYPPGVGSGVGIGVGIGEGLGVGMGDGIGVGIYGLGVGKIKAKCSAE